MDLAWSLFEWPAKIGEAIQNAQFSLYDYAGRFYEELDKEREVFQKRVDAFEVRVAAFKKLSGIDNVDAYADQARELMEEMDGAEKEGEAFNERERLLELGESPYGVIAQYKADFQLYYNLWVMTDDFTDMSRKWLSGSFLSLDAEAIDATVDQWWKLSYKMAKTLSEEAPKAADVAQALRERTGEFREVLPLLSSLGSKALRERHWESLTEGLQNAGMVNQENPDEPFELNPDETLTLQELLDMKLFPDHMDLVMGVSAVAEKEFALERTLKAMMVEWNPINFDLLEYKDTHIVKGTDDIVAVLDDHIVKTQTMGGSPFIKPIKQETKKWEKTLSYVPGTRTPPLLCLRLPTHPTIQIQPRSSPSYACKHFTGTPSHCSTSGSCVNGLGSTSSLSSPQTTSCGRCPRKRGSSNALILSGR